jgi:hypothetical protein
MGHGERERERENTRCMRPLGESHSSSAKRADPRCVCAFIVILTAIVTYSSFRNLIDIPSTLQVERIQQQDAQLRSNEYTIALSTVKLPQQTIRKLTNMTNFKASGADPPGVNDVLETDVGARTGNGPVNGRVRSSTSSGSSIKAPSVREVLAEKTVDPKTVGWVRTHQFWCLGVQK